jgi:hypothetical protein
MKGNTVSCWHVSKHEASRFDFDMQNVILGIWEHWFWGNSSQTRGNRVHSERRKVRVKQVNSLECLGWACFARLMVMAVWRGVLDIYLYSTPCSSPCMSQQGLEKEAALCCAIIGKGVQSVRIRSIVCLSQRRKLLRMSKFIKLSYNLILQWMNPYLLFGNSVALYSWEAR